MFLTYPEYTALGYSQVDEADFPSLAFEAERYIKEKTLNRARLGAGYDEELKRATAKLMEIIQQGEAPFLDAKRRGLPGILTSEVNDGWSGHYDNSASSSTEAGQKALAQRKWQVIQTYIPLESGWRSAVISTCRRAPIFPPLPGPKPPTDGDGDGDGNENGGGDEDMGYKHCDVYPVSDNFVARFSDDGTTVTFDGGPIDYDCMLGQGTIVIAQKAFPFVHNAYLVIDLNPGKVDVDTSPTMPKGENQFIIGRMYRSGGVNKVIIPTLDTIRWPENAN